MDCTEGMEYEPDECLLLVKTIYGIIHSAIQCFKNFNKILVDQMGFQNCE